jgi:TPR repeat protein
MRHFLSHGLLKGRCLMMPSSLRFACLGLFAVALPTTSLAQTGEPYPMDRSQSAAVVLSSGLDTQSNSSPRGITGTLPLSQANRLKVQAENRILQRQYTAAQPMLEQLAANGNVWAMRHLGRFYMHGLGVTPDTALAVRWLTRAAEAGDTESALALGTLYTRVVRTPESEVQARRWLGFAIEHGESHVRMDARSMLSELNRR